MFVSNEHDQQSEEVKIILLLYLIETSAKDGE